MSDRRLKHWETLTPKDTERAKIYVLAGLKAAETRREKASAAKA